MVETTTHDVMVAQTEEVRNLLDYFQRFRGAFDDRLNEAANRWDSFQAIWHVDQATGEDNNDGTADHPFQSIQEAIGRTPYRTRANIRIRGRYDTTRRYAAAGRSVTLIGCAADWSYDDTNQAIDMHLTTQASGSGRIETNGFQGAYQGYWELYNLNLKLKSNAQTEVDHPGGSHRSNDGAIFSHETSSSGNPGGVMLRYCSIDLTDDPYAWVLSSAVWTFSSTSVVYPHSPAGRIVAAVAAGTPSQDVPNLHSNVEIF